MVFNTNLTFYEVYLALNLSNGEDPKMPHYSGTNRRDQNAEAGRTHTSEIFSITKPGTHRQESII